MFEHCFVFSLLVSRHEYEGRWNLLRTVVFLQECVDSRQLDEMALNNFECTIEISLFGILEMV